MLRHVSSWRSDWIVQLLLLIKSPSQNTLTGVWRASVGKQLGENAILIAHGSTLVKTSPGPINIHLSTLVHVVGVLRPFRLLRIVHSVRKASMGSVLAALRAGITRS